MADEGAENVFVAHGFEADPSFAVIVLVSHVLLDAKGIRVLLAKLWHGVDDRFGVGQYDLQVVFRAFLSHDVCKRTLDFAYLMEGQHFAERRKHFLLRQSSLR